MLKSSKQFRAKLASIGLAGAGDNIGIKFRWLIGGVARNPSLKNRLFSYSILGFAFSEATTLFALIFDVRVYQFISIILITYAIPVEINWDYYLSELNNLSLHLGLLQYKSVKVGTGPLNEYFIGITLSSHRSILGFKTYTLMTLLVLVLIPFLFIIDNYIFIIISLLSIIFIKALLLNFYKKHFKFYSFNNNKYSFMQFIQILWDNRYKIIKFIFRLWVISIIIVIILRSSLTAILLRGGYDNNISRVLIIILPLPIFFYLLNFIVKFIKKEKINSSDYYLYNNFVVERVNLYRIIYLISINYVIRNYCYNYYYIVFTTGLIIVLIIFLWVTVRSVKENSGLASSCAGRVASLLNKNKFLSSRNGTARQCPSHNNNVIPLQSGCDTSMALVSAFIAISPVLQEACNKGFIEYYDRTGADKYTYWKKIPWSNPGAHLRGSTVNFLNTRKIDEYYVNNTSREHILKQYRGKLEKSPILNIIYRLKNNDVTLNSPKSWGELRPVTLFSHNKYYGSVSYLTKGKFLVVTIIRHDSAGCVFMPSYYLPDESPNSKAKIRETLNLLEYKYNIIIPLDSDRRANGLIIFTQAESINNTSLFKVWRPSINFTEPVLKTVNSYYQVEKKEDVNRLNDFEICEWVAKVIKEKAKDHSRDMSRYIRANPRARLSTIGGWQMGYSEYQADKYIRKLVENYIIKGKEANPNNFLILNHGGMDFKSTSITLLIESALAEANLDAFYRSLLKPDENLEDLIALTEEELHQTLNNNEYPNQSHPIFRIRRTYPINRVLLTRDHRHAVYFSLYNKGVIEGYKEKQQTLGNFNSRFILPLEESRLELLKNMTRKFSDNEFINLNIKNIYGVAINKLTFEFFEVRRGSDTWGAFLDKVEDPLGFGEHTANYEVYSIIDLQNNSVRLPASLKGGYYNLTIPKHDYNIFDNQDEHSIRRFMDLIYDNEDGSLTYQSDLSNRTVTDRNIRDLTRRFRGMKLEVEPNNKKVSFTRAAINYKDKEPKPPALPKEVIEGYKNRKDRIAVQAKKVHIKENRRKELETDWAQMRELELTARNGGNTVKPSLEWLSMEFEVENPNPEGGLFMEFQLENYNPEGSGSSVDSNPEGSLFVEPDSNPEGSLFVESESSPEGSLFVEPDSNPEGLVSSVESNPEDPDPENCTSLKRYKDRWVKKSKELKTKYKIIDLGGKRAPSKPKRLVRNPFEFEPKDKQVSKGKGVVESKDQKDCEASQLIKTEGYRTRTLIEAQSSKSIPVLNLKGSKDTAVVVQSTNGSKVAAVDQIRVPPVAPSLIITIPSDESSNDPSPVEDFNKIGRTKFPHYRKPSDPNTKMLFAPPINKHGKISKRHIWSPEEGRFITNRQRSSTTPINVEKKDIYILPTKDIDAVGGMASTSKEDKDISMAPDIEYTDLYLADNDSDNDDVLENPDEMDEGDDVEYVRNTPGPDYFVDFDPCGWDVDYYGYDFEGNIRNRREIEATRIYYEARDEEVAAAVATATAAYEAEAAALASGVEIPADTPYGVEVDDDMDYGPEVVSDTAYEGEAARLEAASPTEAASRGQPAPEAEIASIRELGTVTEIVSEAEIASSTGLAAETEVAPEAEIEVVPETEVAPEVEIVPGIEVAADTAENQTATQEVGGEIRTPATPPIVIEISSDESSSDNGSDEDMLRIQPKDIKAAPQPDIVSKISVENSRDTNSNLEQEVDISNINLSEDFDFGPYPRESANSLGLEDEEEYVQPLPESFMDIDPCGCDVDLYGYDYYESVRQIREMEAEINREIDDNRGREEDLNSSNFTTSSFEPIDTTKEDVGMRDNSEISSSSEIRTTPTLASAVNSPIQPSSWEAPITGEDIDLRVTETNIENSDIEAISVEADNLEVPLYLEAPLEVPLGIEAPLEVPVAAQARQSSSPTSTIYSRDASGEPDIDLVTPLNLEVTGVLESNTPTSIIYSRDASGEPDFDPGCVIVGRDCTGCLFCNSRLFDTPPASPPASSVATPALPPALPPGLPPAPLTHNPYQSSNTSDSSSPFSSGSESAYSPGSDDSNDD